MESMSKKEKLARGSAVIKVMRVVPRPGHFLKSYINPRKLPRSVQIDQPKGLLAEMPWLDVKSASFSFCPKSAKIKSTRIGVGENQTEYCNTRITAETDPTKIGLPEGNKMLGWFGYRNWQSTVNPIHDGNIADNFNVVIGLLISMAKDCSNEIFADVEAFPAVQFLRTVKTENGEIPINIAAFISYVEFVCQKQIDEG